MAKVPGIADLAVLSSLGQPTIEIDVDRARAARYGLATGDINSAIQAAIGGEAAGNLYETGSDRNYPDHRAAGAAIPRQPGHDPPDPGGRDQSVGRHRPSRYPLSDGRRRSLVSGAAFIYREHQERYIPIKFSVRGRDLGRGRAGSAKAHCQGRSNAVGLSP